MNPIERDEAERNLWIDQMVTQVRRETMVHMQARTLPFGVKIPEDQRKYVEHGLSRVLLLLEEPGMVPGMRECPGLIAERRQRVHDVFVFVTGVKNAQAEEQKVAKNPLLVDDFLPLTPEEARQVAAEVKLKEIQEGDVGDAELHSLIFAKFEKCHRGLLVSQNAIFLQAAVIRNMVKKYNIFQLHKLMPGF